MMIMMMMMILMMIMVMCQDDEHKGHVLNFQGRVTESSVKNFQLCCKNAPPGLLLDPDEVLGDLIW